MTKWRFAIIFVKILGFSLELYLPKQMCLSFFKALFFFLLLFS